MNIVISGKSDSGKTTAVLRLLKYCREPIYGFFTRKLPAKEAAPVYLHSFREGIAFSSKNLIGTCREHRATSYPEVFDTLGTSILRDIPANSFVVLDEIGVMENEAKVFQAELFQLLDKNCRTLVTIRDISTPLLDGIRKHPASINYTAQQANEQEAEIAAILFPAREG